MQDGDNSEIIRTIVLYIRVYWYIVEMCKKMVKYWRYLETMVENRLLLSAINENEVYKINY